METSHVIRPPRQRRSQETLKRIIAALAELLDEQTFEEVSVQQIVERAGASVGSFYARVGSKEALLVHLREAIYGGAEEELGAFFASERWANESLETMLDAHAEAWVTTHRERRGVTRALIVEARRNAAFAEEAHAFNDRLMKLVVRAWLEKKDEIQHPRPAVAARHAFVMATSFVREAIVFSDMWPAYKPRSDRELARELANMLKRYLTGGPTS